MVSGLICAPSSRAKDSLGARALQRTIAHCHTDVVMLESLKTEMEQKKAGSWQGSAEAETLMLANRLVEHAEVVVADALLPLATQFHSSHVVKQVFVGRLQEHRAFKSKQGGGSGNVCVGDSSGNGSIGYSRSEVEHSDRSSLSLNVQKIVSVQKLAKSLERNCEALSQDNLGNQLLQSIIKSGVPEHASVVQSFIRSHMMQLITDKYGAFLVQSAWQNLHSQQRVDHEVRALITAARASADDDSTTVGDDVKEDQAAIQLAQLSVHTNARHAIRIALELSSPDVAAELQGLIDSGNNKNNRL